MVTGRGAGDKPPETVAQPDMPGPRLLTGGNPQIAKGHGEAPVQAYIAAMPGWKSAVGQQIDRIVTQTVPGVQKAVKWNSPLYGTAAQHWFLGLHCTTHYIKIAFFRGRALTPLPPVASRRVDVRYLHVSEAEPLDADQFADWVRQAGALPGVKM